MQSHWKILLYSPMNEPIGHILKLYLASQSYSRSENYLHDTAWTLQHWLESDSVVDFSQVTLAKLQTWADKKLLTVKPATVSAYLFQIQQFLDWALDRHLIKENPASLVALPRFNKSLRRKFVSAAVAEMLIEKCEDPELKFCLYCGFHAGLRFGEVVMAQPSWFNLDAQVLSVLRSERWDTKDHTDRDVPITDQFREFLEDSYGFPEPYMIGPHKTHKTKWRYRFDFSYRFEQYVHKKGVIITFHDCRRTFASLHAQAGTSLYKIASWLGDGLDIVTQHYAHLCPYDRDVNRAYALKSDD